MGTINYRTILGGLGIFLFGMLVFEETISDLGKGYLKRILEKNVNTRFKSVMTGIIQTCIFQSSTVVTMMTLGFVGAGIIGLINALGILIGANIGTTLTPWLITLLGFKIDIEAFALPLIGVAGLCTIVFAKSEKVVLAAKFFIGLGLLFLGLGYMKEGVDMIAGTISLDQYAHFSIWGYVLIGTLLTAIMQTSTGMTIITLTALNSGLITLDMALGLVIGANMGSAVSTTIVGLLGSTYTQTSKKKLAMSHFIFNITTTILVTLLYPFLRDFLSRLLGLLGDKGDNLIMLSSFHTLFNVILAVIWLPLLDPLMRFLKRLFPVKKLELDLAIDHINTMLPEEMIAALDHDVNKLLLKVEDYNRRVLYLDHQNASPQETHKEYVTIKSIEERLIPYVLKLNRQELTTAQAMKIHVLNDALLHALTSSKHFRSVQHHVVNLKDQSLTQEVSAESIHFFQTLAERTTELLNQINDDTDVISTISVLETGLDALRAADDNFIQSLTDQFTDNENDTDASSATEIIKTNRYVLLACEELVRGYINYLRGT